MIVHYSGDCGTRLSEVQSMYDASGSSVKELAIVPEVDHYGFQITPDGHQGPRSAAGVSKVVDWMRTHFP